MIFIPQKRTSALPSHLEKIRCDEIAWSMDRNEYFNRDGVLLTTDPRMLPLPRDCPVELNSSGNERKREKEGERRRLRVGSSGGGVSYGIGFVRTYMRTYALRHGGRKSDFAWNFLISKEPEKIQCRDTSPLRASE